MESLQDKLRKSRTALDRQGVVLMGRWQRAGAEFMGTSHGAAAAFGRFVADESRGWWSYLQAEVAASRPPRLDAVERELWLQLARLLDVLQGRVQTRIRQLAARPAEAQVDLPLPNYDTLTARAIVARMSELTRAQCRAVFDFEEGHKKRATVLRALEQRLAA